MIFYFASRLRFISKYFRNVKILSFPGANGESKELLTVSHEDLICGKAVIGREGNGEKDRFYVEMKIHVNDEDGPAYKAPQVRCDSGAIASRVAQKINYAKNMYDERKMAVAEDNYEYEQLWSTSVEKNMAVAEDSYEYEQLWSTQVKKYGRSW